MGKTKFSVVISCWNQQNLIAQAVDSALKQTYTQREVIVVDDASTDGSVDVLKSYGSQIRLLANATNQGASAARNVGTELAQGEYIAYLDGDDALKLWALELYDRMIQARRPVMILASMSYFKGQLPDNRETDLPPQIEFVSYENWIDKERKFRSSASAIVVKKNAVAEVGGWKQVAWPFDDYFLLTELAYSGRTIQILDPRSVLYREHQSNASRDVSMLLSGTYSYLEASISLPRLKDHPKRLAGLALTGGQPLWTVRKAWQNGRKIDGLRLLLRASPLIAATAIVRLRAMVLGQRRAEILRVESTTPIRN